MTQDTTATMLVISVLGTTRIYAVLLAGFLASKWPRREREYRAWWGIHDNFLIAALLLACDVMIDTTRRGHFLYFVFTCTQSATNSKTGYTIPGT